MCQQSYNLVTDAYSADHVALAADFVCTVGILRGLKHQPLRSGEFGFNTNFSLKLHFPWNCPLTPTHSPVGARETGSRTRSSGIQGANQDSENSLFVPHSIVLKAVGRKSIAAPGDGRTPSPAGGNLTALLLARPEILLPGDAIVPG